MRNENGYGTVVCLDKTGKKRRKPWAVRVTIGWENGKQKTKYLGYYEKQKDAQIALANYHSKGISLEANNVTFQQIFDMWKEKKQGILTEKNLMLYQASYNLTPILHNKKMRDIKSKQLQDAMDSVDRKYSSKSRLKSLWKQMYEIAMLDDLVMKDYSTGVNIKVTQEESGLSYEKDQISKLWELQSENELAEDIIILIHTGMRISEALGINPLKDFHLESGYFECHGTKNKASDRLIPIHPSIMPILEKRRDRPYLMQNTKGQKAQYRTFAYNYEKLMNTLEWEHIIHDTRKTFATVCHENDMPEEDIKAIIGHTQRGITHKTYVKHRIEHLIEKIKKVQFV